MLARQEGEGTSHVYRLVLKPDNTCRVEIDGEKIYEGGRHELQDCLERGSLKEDWELLAPKEIKGLLKTELKVEDFRWTPGS